MRAQPARSQAYRGYVLAVLTAVWMLNLVDRALVILLLQPIKDDLRLTDTQLGFLTGIAFGLFYATVGLPIARWADRGNRAVITSLAIGLWGLTVMASLFVTNYVQLALARVAAAVGEAGCKPPTYSLVGDYFPDPVSRTRAMSIYNTGGPLAALCSFALGGWLSEAYGWRLTFFLMGIPGLFLAVLVKWTVVDPRTPLREVGGSKVVLPSTRTVVMILWRQRSCRHLCAALVLLYTMGLGLGPWYAAFMARSHGMHTGELGLWLGLTFSIGGISGSLLGGYGASRWFADNERGQMRFSALTVAALVPCYVAFLTVPNRYGALLALVPITMLSNAFLGPTYALLQRLVPDDVRATMMALIMLLANLVGMGLGPQVVGVLSDFLRPTHGEDSLRYAMLALSFVAAWAGYHFWQVGGSVAQDLAARES